LDAGVVDAGFAAPHQPVLVELPQLIAVTAIPTAVGVVPLVLEADGDAIAGEGPQTLSERVVEFALPFVTEKARHHSPGVRPSAAVRDDRKPHPLWQ
jgi:hypothetical protein